METIKLDLIPGKKMPSLHASQYDDGREHGIDLFENGVAYKLDGTETLTINERKGDNCICSLDIENTFTGSNHIVFASTEQMCAVWGNNICELVIAKGEKTIGTLNFILEIEQSPTEGGIESESEIKNLERQIEAITEEVIGDDYYTAEETDEAIATAIGGKADKTYVDTELAKKADKNNTYTKSEVDTLIDNLPEPMIFKGTLGVGGTIQTLPTASASNEGWTFKCITAGTYAGLTLKVGDTVTCFNPPNTSNYYWDKTGSQDTDTDTWRNIKVNGVEKLGNGISSGAVDFEDTTNVKFEFDANGNKIKATLDGIYTESEVDNLLDEKADKETTYTKEEVDDIVYNILPDDTASGSVANFETDLALPIKSLEIDVTAKQDLHGEANPYPAGGGINKWNEEWELGGYSSVKGSAINYTDRIRCKNAIPVLPSTSYCIRFGTTAPSVVNAYDENGDFIENLTTGTFGTDGRVITTPANCYFIKFSVGTAYGTTYNNDISVNYPSTDTAYHPYSNICPIEGWDNIYLKHCKKNWIDIRADNVNNGSNYNVSVENSTVVATATGRYGRVGWSCKVKKGQSYVVKFKAYKSEEGQYGRIYLNDKDGVVGWSNVSYQSAQIKTTNTEHVRYFTARTDTLFVGLYVTADTEQGSITMSDLCVELGSTATDYEPYVGDEYIINLGGTYYGGKFTQDKAGHRQFEVTHALTTVSEMDNNRSWYYSTSNGFWINEGLANTIVKTASGSEVTTAISDYFETVSRNNLKNADDRLCVNTSGYVCIYGSELPTTKNEFLSLVGNAKLVYPLATPYTIDLPDGQQIITLNGTNNIFADTGDTSVVFKDSVNGYVEKKIANVQALILNG